MSPVRCTMHHKPPFLHSPLEAASDFQTRLIEWFRATAAPYPWRQTNDPYEILVSEVMLQQTTVQAVIENKRFERFLESFPDVETLAAASEGEILRAWEGLGYYNRVRNLQRTAQAVLADHGGHLPKSLEGLQSLPGVGPYTAAAVASFAYELPAPLVDANVSRLFSRLFDDDTPVNSPKGQKCAWIRAQQLVPNEEARLYNGALMELGQQICKSKSPLCHQCPISSYCQARNPASLPVKLAKQKTETITEHALWCQRPNGDLLMEKGADSRRRGLWRLPLVSAEIAQPYDLLSQTNYTITKYKVTLKVYAIEAREASTGEWISLAELDDLPMPSPIRRVVNKLLNQLL